MNDQELRLRCLELAVEANLCKGDAESLAEEANALLRFVKYRVDAQRIHNDIGNGLASLVPDAAMQFGNILPKKADLAY